MLRGMNGVPPVGDGLPLPPRRSTPTPRLPAAEPERERVELSGAGPSGGGQAAGSLEEAQELLLDAQAGLRGLGQQAAGLLGRQDPARLSALLG